MESFANKSNIRIAFSYLQTQEKRVELTYDIGISVDHARSNEGWLPISYLLYCEQIDNQKWLSKSKPNRLLSSALLWEWQTLGQKGYQNDFGSAQYKSKKIAPSEYTWNHLPGDNTD